MSNTFRRWLLFLRDPTQQPEDTGLSSLKLSSWGKVRELLCIVASKAIDLLYIFLLCFFQECWTKSCGVNLSASPENILKSLCFFLFFSFIFSFEGFSLCISLPPCLLCLSHHLFHKNYLSSVFFLFLHHLHHLLLNVFTRLFWNFVEYILRTFTCILCTFTFTMQFCLHWPCIGLVHSIITAMHLYM